MKKFLITFSLIFVFSLVTLITILSTVGLKTNKFNNLISSEIKKKNDDIFFKFKQIKFKFDLKNASLFLETEQPTLTFQKIDTPIRNIKVYLKLFSLLQSNTEIEKIIIETKIIKISNLQKIISKMKPSNFNSFILNRAKNGQLRVNLEVFFDEKIDIKNFIAKGEVEKLEISLFNNIQLNNTNFNFFADNSDVLIKNISSETKGVKLNDGNLQIQKINEDLKIKLDILSKIEIDQNFLKRLPISKKIEFTPNELRLDGKLNHNLAILFDKTYMIKEYDYSIKAEIDELILQPDVFSTYLLDEEIERISFKNSKLDFKYSSSTKNTINSSGKYKLNNNNYVNYDFETEINQDNLKANIDLEITENLNLNIINYTKKKGTIANVSTILKKNKDKIIFEKIDYIENKSSISINNLLIINSKIKSLNNINVKTFSDNNLKNDFTLDFGKKINVSGKKYDSTKLSKIFENKEKNEFLNLINKDIEISFEEIETPLAKKLSNFKLIGIIRGGKFVKISSKGDFGDNKFLDISLKSDKKSKKKYLEIYSDFPQPLLTQYSFFKGLSDGKMIFSSIIENDISNSKLIIENFKIKNAPGVIKLLSLADFGGLADLASGEGLSFDKLEINMSSNPKLIKLNELFAVGPSISVLMEGYKEKNGLTSLRGTLVPAKNLNKFLSKIPVIGNIIIPQEVGEGLFGVSFKMKGMPGKIKTTINPIKTLTPRFITKALEKSKN